MRQRLSRSTALHTVRSSCTAATCPRDARCQPRQPGAVGSREPPRGDQYLGRGQDAHHVTQPVRGRCPRSCGGSKNTASRRWSWQLLHVTRTCPMPRLRRAASRADRRCTASSSPAPCRTTGVPTGSVPACSRTEARTPKRSCPGQLPCVNDHRGRSEPGPGGAGPSAVIRAGCAGRGGGGQGKHRMGLGNGGPDARSGLAVFLAGQPVRLSGKCLGTAPGAGTSPAAPFAGMPVADGKSPGMTARAGQEPWPAREQHMPVADVEPGRRRRLSADAVRPGHDVRAGRSAAPRGRRGQGIRDVRAAAAGGA